MEKHADFMKEYEKLIKDTREIKNSFNKRRLYWRKDNQHRSKLYKTKE